MSRFEQLRHPLLAVCLSTVSCAGAGQPGHTFDIIEEDGVPVAVNSGVPTFDGELFTYEKTLVIRPDPENPESLLYGPSTFVLGDDGLYYVADRGNHRIVVFDADGHFLRAFGREGQGPGELQNPAWVEARDGLVLVIGLRTTIFRTDGSLVDVLSSPHGRFARPTSDGLIVVENSSRATREDRRYTGAIARVIDQVGEVIATIETAQVGTDPMLAYAGAPSVLLTPNEEIVATTGAEPEISWYGLDGRLLRKGRIDLPVQPVSGEDRAAVEELWDRLIERVERLEGAGSGDPLRELKGRVSYPDAKAFWTRPILDGAGWLWLPDAVADTGISVAGAPIETRPRFRIVDSRGEFIGTTGWPEEALTVRGSTISRGYLLTMVWDDEAEAMLPTVFRIHPVVDGLRYPPDDQ